MDLLQPLIDAVEDVLVGLCKLAVIALGEDNVLLGREVGTLVESVQLIHTLLVPLVVVFEDDIDEAVVDLVEEEVAVRGQIRRVEASGRFDFEPALVIAAINGVSNWNPVAISNPSVVDVRHRRRGVVSCQQVECEGAGLVHHGVTFLVRESKIVFEGPDSLVGVVQEIFGSWVVRE